MVYRDRRPVKRFFQVIPREISKPGPQTAIAAGARAECAGRDLPHPQRLKQDGSEVNHQIREGNDRGGYPAEKRAETPVFSYATGALGTGKTAAPRKFDTGLRMPRLTGDTGVFK